MAEQILQIQHLSKSFGANLVLKDQVGAEALAKMLDL